MKRIGELWELIDTKEMKVQCHVCAHHCIIMPDSLGFCKTRINLKGTLFTLVYGSLSSSGSIDPIEKKPLYHFYPNSNAFSIATIGCNLRCQHCQNWHISKSYPDVEGKIAQFNDSDKNELSARSFPLTELSPDQIIKKVRDTNSQLIAYTYNEPLIWFEYVKDTSLLAKDLGVKNVLVTGGYSSEQANQEYIKFIDAANIDFKGFTNEFYKKYVGISDFTPILNTAKFFKQNNIHVEITNLIIPNENDHLEDIERMVIWIKKNLGIDTPLHFSAYYPQYRTNQPRTSPKILTQAWEIAKNVGLRHVFLGNIVSHEGSSTICPNCHTTLIQRHGYAIKNVNLSNQNRCKKCGEEIAIVGNYSISKRTRFI